MSKPKPAIQPLQDSLSVPTKYSEHPLVQRELFFTLPGALLECLTTEIGRDRFDAQAWEMEFAMTQACGDKDGVGFWAGKRMQFPLLQYSSLEIDPALGASLRWTAEQIEIVNTTGRARADRFANTARGYAGWLLTNRDFLAEQHSVLAEWKVEVAEFHIPRTGAVVTDHSLVAGASSPRDSRLCKFARAFEEFFVHWRLEGLPAPFLPSPLRPQMPVAILASVLGHMRDGGQTFYMPDTFPVPTRDELRDLMEDALRGPGTPDHLAEWIANVQAGNSAKNAVSRYARVFELQHYVRVLYQRHKEALHRRKSSVNQAFAAFFQFSVDTIERDLAFVADRLGEDWWMPASLPPKS